MALTLAIEIAKWLWSVANVNWLWLIYCLANHVKATVSQLASRIEN